MADESNRSISSEGGGKPKSRLLAMKERLRSQRGKSQQQLSQSFSDSRDHNTSGHYLTDHRQQTRKENVGYTTQSAHNKAQNIYIPTYDGHSQSFTASSTVTSQTGVLQPRYNIVTSQLQSVSAAPSALPVKKTRSFFSFGRHSKSKSVEVALEDMPGAKLAELSKKEKRKLEKKEKKIKAAEEKKFLKLSKSKSSDRLLETAFQSPVGNQRLNKSLDERTTHSVMDKSQVEERSVLVNEDNNNSKPEMEIKYRVLRKIPSDTRFTEKTRQTHRSSSVESTVRKKIVRSDSQKQVPEIPVTVDPKRNVTIGAYSTTEERLYRGQHEGKGHSARSTSRAQPSDGQGHYMSRTGSHEAKGQPSSQVPLYQGSYTGKDVFQGGGRSRSNFIQGHFMTSEHSSRAPSSESDYHPVPNRQRYAQNYTSVAPNVQSSKQCTFQGHYPPSVNRVAVGDSQVVPSVRPPIPGASSRDVTPTNEIRPPPNVGYKNVPAHALSYSKAYNSNSTQRLHSDGYITEGRAQNERYNQRSGIAGNREPQDGNFSAMNLKLSRSLENLLMDEEPIFQTSHFKHRRRSNSVRISSSDTLKGDEDIGSDSVFSGKSVRFSDRERSQTPPTLTRPDKGARKSSSTSSYLDRNPTSGAAAGTKEKTGSNPPVNQLYSDNTYEYRIEDLRREFRHLLHRSKSAEGREEEEESDDWLEAAVQSGCSSDYEGFYHVKRELSSSDDDADLYIYYQSRSAAQIQAQIRPHHQPLNQPHHQPHNQPNFAAAGWSPNQPIREQYPMTSSGQQPMRNASARSDVDGGVMVKPPLPPKSAGLRRYVSASHCERSHPHRTSFDPSHPLRTSFDGSQPSNTMVTGLENQRGASRTSADSGNQIGMVTRGKTNHTNVVAMGNNAPVSMGTTNSGVYSVAGNNMAAGYGTVMGKSSIPVNSQAMEKGSVKGGGLRVTMDSGDAVARQKSERLSTAETRPTSAPVRRHTVTVAETLGSDMEKFADRNKSLLQHLAGKFPAHAAAIAGTSQELPPDQQYHDTGSNHPIQRGDRNESYYEAIGELERVSAHSGHRSGHVGTHPTGSSEPPELAGQFTRGMRLRNSLPIVKSPNRSLEKPLGLVFLVFQNETKRALLPNEVTSQDTIRALFARAFAPVVTMAWFERTRARVYIQDPSAQLFYELEDLRDVRDRSVLKILLPEETYGTLPASTSQASLHSPSLHHTGFQQQYPGPLLPTSSRLPSSSPRLLPTSTRLPPSSVANGYDSDSSVRSAPLHFDRSQGRSGHYSSPQQLTSHYGPASQVLYSPRLVHNSRSPHDPTNRHSVAYLGGGGVGVHDNPLYACAVPPPGVASSSSFHEYPGEIQRTSGTTTPVGEDRHTRERMEKMEAQLASLTALVQRASRPSSALSSKATSETDSVTPTLQSPSIESNQGGSERSELTPQLCHVSADFVTSLRQLQERVMLLRRDQQLLRKLQLHHTKNTREAVNQTYLSIKLMIERVPGARDHPVRAQRMQTNTQLHEFKEQAGSMQTDISDLASAVDEIRRDVVERGCRVNKDEVQTLALALGNVSKQLAILKGRFPGLQDSLKQVMASELEIVVAEEKLASVQEKQPPRPPPQLGAGEQQEPGEGSLRTSVLSNIQALVPDHQQRLQSIQAASAARHRKKRLTAQAESLRFEKSLEVATKNLKSTAQQEPGGDTQRNNSAGNQAGLAPDQAPARQQTSTQQAQKPTSLQLAVSNTATSTGSVSNNSVSNNAGSNTARSNNAGSNTARSNNAVSNAGSKTTANQSIASSKGGYKNGTKASLPPTPPKHNPPTVYDPQDFNNANIGRQNVSDGSSENINANNSATTKSIPKFVENSNVNNSATTKTASTSSPPLGSPPAPAKPPRLYTNPTDNSSVIPVPSQRVTPAPSASTLQVPSHDQESRSDVSDYSESHSHTEESRDQSKIHSDMICEHNNSRLSTFVSEILTSTPNCTPLPQRPTQTTDHQKAGTQQTVTSPNREVTSPTNGKASPKHGNHNDGGSDISPPPPPPPAFSDACNVSQVSMDTSVTSLGTPTSGGKTKKIPPPPPPRKSSRVTSGGKASTGSSSSTPSPSSQIPRMNFDRSAQPGNAPGTTSQLPPPTYENVSSLMSQGWDGSGGSSPTGEARGQDSPNKMSPSRIAKPFIGGGRRGSGRGEGEQQDIPALSRISEEKSDDGQSGAERAGDESDSSAHSQDTVRRRGNQPNNQANSQPGNQANSHPGNQSGSQSSEQSGGQSSAQHPSNQPSNQYIGHFENQHNNRPGNQASIQPNNQHNIIGNQSSIHYNTEPSNQTNIQSNHHPSNATSFQQPSNQLHNSPVHQGLKSASPLARTQHGNYMSYSHHNNRPSNQPNTQPLSGPEYTAGVIAQGSKLPVTRGPASKIGVLNGRSVTNGRGAAQPHSTNQKRINYSETEIF